MDIALLPIEVLRIRRVFEDLQLDPYAGVSLAKRLSSQARRVSSFVARNALKLEQRLLPVTALRRLRSA